MNKKETVYLSPPHMSGNEQKYIQDAFDSNWIAPLGPNVDQFEKEVASSVGVKGAVAVNSGTAAIHLALRLLGVGPGDTVLCSTLTFVASANPILYLGAKPVFIDSEPDTWNMSPQALERALKDAKADSALPKAILVVHLYGQISKMDEILNICNKFSVPVIEDAAESLGSTYKGRAGGTMGEFGIYSFNGNKIITTSGGGMLVSNNQHALDKARFWATQAKDNADHYEHSEIGFNYRMSNILAGIGRAQLEVLEHRVQSRRLIFNQYKFYLSGLPGITFMSELENSFSNRWLTSLLIDESQGVSKCDLLNFLHEANIEARHVWKPLHLQPLFKGTAYYPHNEDEHVAVELFEKGICLPSGSGMTKGQQAKVINRILDFFSINDICKGEII
ncbi:aminotransferase class I/II-fold pyridoxal phosphate-dependent enzyme [Bacillus norwichensis]|uniref:Aminotransferase class I/II-fold pyridoxal phosphate-dependent enzyme n=1 Tax=Bacillus norwichensis TaxID=2762217 RepID=A0ABR8VJ06_9BACI|nr:aminotransferase class I/II-fold pyridoxal phosphate-dependent enzyme [Bacillus norwichensis]MBD8004752.1 aminotransferase class I/II-fold pyridoxal phosphate-dependent enzyme [Bacillus norwichensis]